jgi:hypothetical protein
VISEIKHIGLSALQLFCAFDNMIWDKANTAFVAVIAIDELFQRLDLVRLKHHSDGEVDV